MARERIRFEVTLAEAEAVTGIWPAIAGGLAAAIEQLERLYPAALAITAGWDRQSRAQTA